MSHLWLNPPTQLPPLDTTRPGGYTMSMSEQKIEQKIKVICWSSPDGSFTYIPIDKITGIHYVKNGEITIRTGGGNYQIPKDQVDYFLKLFNKIFDKKILSRHYL